MRRIWTREEEEYLMENIGTYKLDTLASHLNRTPVSVELKMKRMGIGNTRKQVGLLTMGELAHCIQVDRNTVKHWAEHHGLPYIKRKTKQKRTFYFVDTTDFWKWAFEHQDRVDFSKIEKHVLPPEPTWVDAARAIKREKTYRNWTTLEESLLIEYVTKKKPLTEIAKKLNRSLYSIERKYYRLKKLKKVD
ncbi:MAG TPA: DNA-binding protein [Candidatus Avamphibacillus intestinigallinarum]|nr:DNA-binding protein [Candidatus Avamphibacillus intestinigallinarum]